MSIREITMYTACCDRCGASVDEGTEYAGWVDTETAEMIHGGSLTINYNAVTSDLSWKAERPLRVIHIGVNA